MCDFVLKALLRPFYRCLLPIKDLLFPRPYEAVDFDSIAAAREVEQEKWKDELCERRELARSIMDRSDPLISTDMGLSFLDEVAETDVAPALDAMGHIVKSGLYLSNKKQFLQQCELDLESPDILPLIELITSDSVLGPVTHYLKEIPIVGYMLISHSPKERVFEGSSQYYHLDGTHYPLDVDKP